MTEKQHILIVDDDSDIRDLLGKYLHQNGYKTSLAAHGQAMHAILQQPTPVDLVILDVMLPGDDGYALCRQLRQQSNIPIIMLTAIGEEFERIVGLEIGADDYMSKPFNSRELLARIKAVLRRSSGTETHADDSHSMQPTTTVYQFEGWTLDKDKRFLLSPDQLEISLTSGEFELLIAFLERPNCVLSRDQLLNLTKNRDATPFDRSIDIQISRLRRRIETDPKKPQLIKTVRGGGYVFATTVNVQQDNP